MPSLCGCFDYLPVVGADGDGMRAGHVEAGAVSLDRCWRGYEVVAEVEQRDHGYREHLSWEFMNPAEVDEVACPDGRRGSDPGGIWADEIGHAAGVGRVVDNYLACVDDDAGRSASRSCRSCWPGWTLLIPLDGRGAVRARAVRILEYEAVAALDRIGGVAAVHHAAGVHRPGRDRGSCCGPPCQYRQGSGPGDRDHANSHADLTYLARCSSGIFMVRGYQLLLSACGECGGITWARRLLIAPMRSIQP